MPVQDLTPQLRTRLSQVERAVGWFVVIATVLLVGGFGYYLYQTGERKGWFKDRVPYFTYVSDATGLDIGDPVRLTGFNVGEIVEIEATEAGNSWFNAHDYNVYVKFVVIEPYYGYIWTDSRVRVDTGALLGERVLEVTRGSVGIPTVTMKDGEPIRILQETVREQNDMEFDYVLISEQSKGYWIRSEETPPLPERLDQIAIQVQEVLSTAFQFTNQLTMVLSNTASLTASLDETARHAQPALSNLVSITSMLNRPDGALGEWLLSTNMRMQLEETLSSADSALNTADHTLEAAKTNMVVLARSLNESLENLASITGTLRTQVSTNDQILSELSSAIVSLDDLVQGLKQHWLLRSAFDREEEDEAERGTLPPTGLPARGGRGF